MDERNLRVSYVLSPMYTHITYLRSKTHSGANRRTIQYGDAFLGCNIWSDGVNVPITPSELYGFCETDKAHLFSTK